MKTDLNDDLSDPLDYTFDRVLILHSEEASNMILELTISALKHEYLYVDSKRFWKLL